MIRRVLGLVVLLALHPIAAVAQTQPRTSGTISATDGAVTLNLGLAGGTAFAVVTGSWSATLNIEISADCATYIAQPKTQTLSVTPTLGATTTGNGNFLIPLEGAQCVRVRANPYSSGTATVVLAATATSGVVSLGAAIPTGANTIGAVTVSGSVTTSPPSNASTNVAQFGGSNVVTGTGASGSGIPRVTVSNDSTVTANAGTDLNTSALALDATVTGRLPAGASPADNESNTNTNLSRIGNYTFVFDGATWDRWTGGVTQSGTWNLGTITTVTAVSDAQVQGKAAHDAAVSGNPVLVGGYASVAAPSDVSADGDAVRAWLLRSGAQVVQPSFAGVLTTTGNGASGTGVQRVTIASDSTGQIKVTDGSDTAQITTTAGGSLQVECTSGCGGSGGTSAADGASYVAGTTSGTPMMGARDDTSPGTVAEDKVGIARLTTNRAIHVNLRDASGNEVSVGGGTQYTQDAALTIATSVGTMAMGRASAAAPADVSANDDAVLPWYLRSGAIVQQPSYAGVLASTGNGTAGTGTPRVTIASDNTAFGVNAAQSGTWNLTNVSGTVSLPTGASTLAEQQTQTTALQLIDNLPVTQGSTTSGQSGALIQGAVTTGAPTYTTAQTSPLSLTTTGLLRTDGSGVTQPVTGTVTTTPPSNATTNVTQFGGTNVSTGTGAGGAGIPRVTISNDSSLAANQSVNVAQINGVATTMNNGIAGTGVQRVTIASDSTGQVTLATGANTIGALTANQSVNTAQFGGSAVATGTGVGGAGIPRVTVSSDSALTANAGTNLNTSALALETTQVSGNTLLSTLDTDLRGTGGYDTTLLAILRAILQQGTPQTAARLKGSFGRAVTSTGDALDVNVKYPAATFDPCGGPLKWNVAISQTANTVLLTKVPGRVFVCAALIVGADAENITLVEGSGTTCGTGTAGVIGGTTAANGTNLAANGGYQAGNGAAAIAITTTPGNDVCLLQSGSGRVAGNLTYALLR